MEYPKPIPVTEIPPADVNVLVQDQELGWWQAKYLPEEDDPRYQPDAWELVGLDGWKGEVTHWMPMPPTKPR